MYLTLIKHSLCFTELHKSDLCLFVVFFFLQDDFAHNREFITMVVYKTDGKKVYYPG